MKLRSKLGCLCCLFVTTVASTCAIVMNSEEVAAKSDKESTYDYQLEKEAMKYVALEDVDSTTGRLKEGVIYNVGGDGVYLTSNGLVEYSVNEQNTGMASVVTAKPQITVIPAESDRGILFSNNVILDFDVSYDESNVYVETKRNKLISTTYQERSYNETRSRLVWKSYVKKIWFAKVRIWYLDIEKYQETVIERTPIETYQEEKSTSLTINLNENNNLIAKAMGKIVDKYIPELRTMSVSYGIPIAIAFMDTILSVAKGIVNQVLSIIAEFIPVLDEVKTSYETLKGKDMFTGEKISLGWRIFGGITLLVGVVTSVFTFGASMAVIDVASDAVVGTKKASKVGEMLLEAPDTVHDTVKLLDNAKTVANSSDAITDSGKMIGNIKVKSVDLDSASTFSQTPFKRGFVIDEFAGNIKNADNASEVIGLGRTAKTFDVLDTTSETLVSVKSLDTGAETYKNGVSGANAMKRTIKKYIDVADYSKVAKTYSGTTEASKGLQKGIDFTKTGLDLYIPKGGFNSHQQAAIEDIIKSLPDNFVLNIIELS